MRIPYSSIALALLLFAVTADSHAQSLKLNTFNTRNYSVHTNVGTREAKAYGTHMDAVFDEYKRRFQQRNFKAKRGERMDLYIFETQQDYIAFLKGYGIDATNSAGMFFITRDIRGLGTFVRGRPVTDVFSTLQHEGFHQFAFAYIGPELPIWINEGIAQYFEDGILIRKKMHLNLVSPHRLLRVKSAVDADRHISFDEMLAMSSQQWSMNVRTSPLVSSLQYEQSWSMTHFLISGDDGRYTKAFEQYLMDVGKGTPSLQAFENAFGSTDPKPFEAAWKRHVAQQQPDELSSAIQRMKFLATAMSWMVEKDIDIPNNMTLLRHALQKRGFYAEMTMQNIKVRYEAKDNSLFEYTLPNGQTRMLELLAPERRDLMPRVYAPGLRPEPTLIWYRDDASELFSDVAFK